MVILELILWLTIVGTIATVFSAVIALLAILMSKRQKKKEKQLEALGKLKQARNELCVAMNIGEINALLNNAIAICDEKKSDSKSLMGIQNQLQSIVREVNYKWNSLKVELVSSGNDNLSERLYVVIQEYLFCFRDVETIVAAIRCKKIDNVESLMSSENSEEMRSIVESIKSLYRDVYKFVNQAISLRFKDLEIPDYAEKIRQIWDDESKLPINTNTRLLAAIGNPMAQLALGNYYFDRLQFKKAYYWYKKSAEQGLAQAQYNISACYDNGEGVEKDEKKAFEWCKKAAEQGHPQAQMQLGVFFEKGNVVAIDESTGFEWCKKAAEQGCVEAQYFLGQHYRYGIGVVRDEKKAFEWYKKSAEQGYAAAQHSLGVCFFAGIGTIRNEVKAYIWFKKSAEQSVADAQYNLSVCYRDGIAVEKDIKKEIEWLEKAAEQGFGRAQYNLGLYYKEGGKVEKNEKAAFELVKKAAEQCLAAAQYTLGSFYDSGIGCDQNFNRAYYWYSKASESKEDIEAYRRALYCIGRMYEYGTIGTISKRTAVGFYEIAAQYGYDVAQCRMGFCYETGMGVKEIDIEKAKYWYEEAAKQGNEEAIASLARLNAN